jgi:recombination protein RecA
MQKEVLKGLKNIGLLSAEKVDLGFVSTGNYAINKVISGDYTKGIPIGMMTQFIGEASTGKTVFATHILKEAQAVGYHTMLVDSENAYNPVFAASLGIDPEDLNYTTPKTLEECFQIMEYFILFTRETDKDTPIVIAYDSIAVSPSKAEVEATSYDQSPMTGAIRAKTTGACLRKINSMLREHKVALVIINQIRTDVGKMFGNPDTAAAGGKALEYYLGVNLQCKSNKTGDLIYDENKQVIGIKGIVKNKKNKVSIPFRECEFELIYDKGLTPSCGMLTSLVKDKIVIRSGAWYTYKELKFQRKGFEEDFLTSDEFSELRKEIGI